MKKRLERFRRTNLQNTQEMKQTAIRSALTRIVAAVMFLMGPVTVSAQYQMVVYTDDGLTYPFNIERIDSISFVLMNTDYNGNDEKDTTATGDASEITNNSATITAWAKIHDKMPTDLKVGIIFTATGIPDNSTGTQMTVIPSSLDSDGRYMIKLTELTSSTTYYYRSFVYRNGVWLYGDVKDFTTMGNGEEPVPGGSEGIGGGHYD